MDTDLTFQTSVNVNKSWHFFIKQDGKSEILGLVNSYLNPHSLPRGYFEVTMGHHFLGTLTTGHHHSQQHEGLRFTLF